MKPEKLNIIILLLVLGVLVYFNWNTLSQFNGEKFSQIAAFFGISINSKKRLEETVLSSVKSDLVNKNIKCIPDSITLISKGHNQYDGIVYFPKNINIPITVTSDNSDLVWKIDNLTPIVFGCN